MCGEELENLRHFLLHCPAYDEERTSIPALQRPYQQDEEDTIGRAIFENTEMENIKTAIYKFWQKKRKEKKGRRDVKKFRKPKDPD